MAGLFFNNFYHSNTNSSRTTTAPVINGYNIQKNISQSKVYVINFWATWCSPCRKELPFFKQLYKRYKKQGLVIIAVNIDKNPAKAKRFVKRQNLSFPVVYDLTHKIVARYNPTAMPTSFIIDSSGIIRYIHKGFRNKSKKLFHKEIRLLLKPQRK